MSARRASALLAFAAALFATADARADRAYAQPGPHAVKVSDLGSSIAQVQIAAPDGGGPWPLLVASHGWSASGANQLGWARHFASWGFVVAVPTFPSPLAPDVDVDSSLIVSLASDLGGASASAWSVMPGKVGLEGHSAGGLATTVAAQKLGAAAGAVVLFDPVDANGVGQKAYATLCSPILALFAQASSCNDEAGWRPFAKATSAEVVGFDVVDSTHCDGENADRGALCGLACGGAASADRQAVYASYATAFFLARLVGDALAASVLADASVAADTAVASPLHTASTCVAADAGAPSGADASAPAAAPPSGTSAAAPSPNAPSAAPVGADAPPAAGCGCGVAGTNALGGALASLGSLALLVARRARRRFDRRESRGPASDR